MSTPVKPPADADRTFYGRFVHDDGRSAELEVHRSTRGVPTGWITDRRRNGEGRITASHGYVFRQRGLRKIMFELDKLAAGLRSGGFRFEAGERSA